MWEQSRFTRSFCFGKGCKNMEVFLMYTECHTFQIWPEDLNKDGLPKHSNVLNLWFRSDWCGWTIGWKSQVQGPILKEVYYTLTISCGVHGAGFLVWTQVYNAAGTWNTLTSLLKIEREMEYVARVYPFSSKHWLTCFPCISLSAGKLVRSCSCHETISRMHSWSFLPCDDCIGTVFCPHEYFGWLQLRLGIHGQLRICCCEQREAASSGQSRVVSKILLSILETCYSTEILMDLRISNVAQVYSKQGTHLKTYVYSLTIPTVASSISLVVAPLIVLPDRHNPTVSHLCLPGYESTLQCSVSFFHSVFRYHQVIDLILDFCTPDQDKLDLFYSCFKIRNCLIKQLCLRVV